VDLMIAALRKPGRRWALVAVTLLALVFLSPLVVRPALKRVRAAAQRDADSRPATGLARILRELQFSLADMCYNKSTLYLHSGVRYSVLEEDAFGDPVRQDFEAGQVDDAATTESPSGETPQAQAAPTRKGDRNAYEHVRAVPFIASEKEDFRGIIGKVEREVKPYSTEHVPHKKQQEALPWLRLATILNPEHGKAWIGAADTLRRTGRTTQAIELLQKALVLNPILPDKPYDRYEIPYMLAHLYIDEQRAFEPALEVLKPTIDRGEKDFKRLDEVQQDWLAFCFRYAIQAYRKTGDLASGIATAKRAVRLYPDDKPMWLALWKLERIQKERNAETP
jgi:tetratricopeptide (TPR) repeat protein